MFNDHKPLEEINWLTDQIENGDLKEGSCEGS